MRRYRAFGLDLEASFPLIGMPPDRGTRGAADLRLRIADDEEMAALWSGERAPVWQATLGRQTFVLQAGRDGDHRMTWSGGAEFHLDRGLREVSCRPPAAGIEWQRVLLDTVLTCVLLLRGGQALHAAAVVGPAGAIAIVAASGGGKSTLTAELMGRGLPLLSDDILPLSLAAARPLAARGTPHMNLSIPLERETAPSTIGRTLAVFGREAWLVAHPYSAQDAPLDAICLLERREGLPTKLDVLPPNPLALVPHTLGLARDPEAARERFLFYGDVAAKVPVLRLTAAPEVPPELLGDLVEAHISRGGTAAVEALVA